MATKGEWNTSIKGETNKDRGGPEGLAGDAKPAHIVSPVGASRDYSLMPRSYLSSPLSTNDIVGGLFTYESNFILELLQIAPLTIGAVCGKVCVLA